MRLKRPVQAARPGAWNLKQTQQAHVAQGAQAQPMQARVLQAGPSTVGNLPFAEPEDAAADFADAADAGRDSLPD